ncbi:MAG: TIGR04283 family arsenosugar biosynthesis glycosyltransferase [Opitutaceae bacterium]|nr:TIGR04283 family arsenosugar biosynthesis glycosyltransferase [Opitutaceae bacterium]
MRARLILMLKFPRPGAVKTRLIPALGAERACALHRALVAATLATIREFSATTAVAVEVRITGSPDDQAARAWLGEGVAIREQGEGDLGARMERAIAAAFAEGMEQVVVIGGDCPEIRPHHLAAAFGALTEREAVLGPAADGGYYLIGLRRPLSALFRGIAWGGAEVRAQTLAAAQTHGVSLAALEQLRDIDIPEDLPVWAATPAARASGQGGVSVVIPALNEEETLPVTLAAVRAGGPFEIIVVDGGSRDRTLAVARAHEAIGLSAEGGRASQLNAGAAAAVGEFLLFLHADTLPPPGYADIVRATLARPGVAAGAFAFAITGEFSGRRLIEAGANWRARRLGLPYGDQGLFLRRDAFEGLGGFPVQSIMEDYAMVRRLKSRGDIVVTPEAALTSGRRWRERGAIQTMAINQLVLAGYALGVAPARLARWYRGE